MRPYKKFARNVHSSGAEFSNTQGNISAGEGGSTHRAQAWTRTPNWTEPLDACLLGLLIDEHTLGNNVNGTFTTLAWARVVSEFNRRNNTNLSKNHVKNRLKVLKRTFSLYHALVNKSGWGWDHILNIPTAGDSSDWDAVIAENPQYSKCRDKPFPPYKDLEFITEKTTATGRYSIASLAPAATTVLSSSSSSPGEEANILGPRMSGLYISQNPFEAGSSGPPVNENIFTAQQTSRSSSPPPAKKPTSGSGHSSAGKRRRSPEPEPSQQRTTPTTGGRRRKNEGFGDAVAEMVKLGKDKLDLVRHMYNHELESKRIVPTITDCMTRVYNLPGLNFDQVLAAGEALKDVNNRELFSTMSDELAVLWVARQIVPGS